MARNGSQGKPPATSTSSEVLTADYRVEQAAMLADFLAAKTGLAKARIKECLTKGGVETARGNGRFARSRKAKTMLLPADRVRLAYDPAILALVPPTPRLIADLIDYSVWDKPAGLLAQGTRFGDHCSLLRLAQLAFVPQRETYLVHRLDREASGLMLIAHSKRAAAGLSRLFQEHRVVKEYTITVRGLWDQAETGTLCQPLDGKEAITDYRLLTRNPEQMTSSLLVSLRTGRLHQIRRHFALAGFPLMGDSRYGTGNKDRAGLALRSVRLAFDCPLSGKPRDFK
jgi:tRNA pseudouridine32 synthase/23S rRNA pseudouridine746 synthase